jgi:hypothetical protein
MQNSYYKEGQRVPDPESDTGEDLTSHEAMFGRRRNNYSMSGSVFLAEPRSLSEDEAETSPELYHELDDARQATEVFEGKEQSPVQSPLVELNVGGKKFQTSRGTLLRSESDSFFNSLLRFNPNEQTYFIDRDPRVFHLVMAILRGQQTELLANISANELELLIYDCDFYALTRDCQVLTDIRDRSNELKEEERVRENRVWFPMHLDVFLATGDPSVIANVNNQHRTELNHKVHFHKPFKIKQLTLEYEGVELEYFTNTVAFRVHLCTRPTPRVGTIGTGDLHISNRPDNTEGDPMWMFHWNPNMVRTSREVFAVNLAELCPLPIYGICITTLPTILGRFMLKVAGARCVELM